LAVLGAAFVSMALYAAVGARRDADSERKGSRFLAGVGGFLVHWFMWLISPLERLALALGVTPDMLNFGGLCFGLLSGGLIANGLLHAAAWAIAAGGVCDILDGRIARTRMLESDYGKFIDSTLDRFVEVFVFLGFVYLLRGTHYGAFLAACAACGSLLVSYARARGESVGVPGPKGLMQRAERLALTTLACAADGPLTLRFGQPPGTIVTWTMGAIAAGTLFTAAHRTIAIGIALRRRAVVSDLQRPL
jgi:CDP-diacylglycerol--glycerol-3-phosphate 3-phosphatidyltransferase